MGAITSRQHAGVEEVDVIANHQYKYPPRSGNYFGSHFIMGGERFDTPQPESYLFGENSDLNFLGSRPTPFPYPPPQPNEPTKTLKSLVNIRKESLRFVRAPPDYGKPIAKIVDRVGGDGEPQPQRDVELGKSTNFNLEFTFDCDVRCSIVIYYFCTEEFTSNGVTYVPKDPAMTSEVFHYKRGANQQFCQMTHTFDPSGFNEEDLSYDIDRDVIPIAIHCVVEEGPEELRQSHTTIATVEKITDGTYILKALKQKLFVDGLCYLLQEIYGIENKNNDKANDDDTEDNGSECVICMCDVRDTLILPCRHLCLCNSCADSLRYQANNCPICRAPFRALLQIRALQKSPNAMLAPALQDGSCDNIPPGYEAVSLIEALNGPCIPRQPPAAMPDLVETPETEPAIQAAQILNGHSIERTPSKSSKDNSTDSPPEFGMSVLMSSRDDEVKEMITQKCPLLSSSTSLSNLKTNQTESINKQASPRLQQQQLNVVKIINERGNNNQQHSNKQNHEREHENQHGDGDDSETEKLSPLLSKNDNCATNNASLIKPLNMADVVDAIDDTDHEEEDEEEEGQVKHEESDYYTPEEPAQPHLGQMYEEAGPISSSMESTPQRMPGTPLSHASARSSGDSYTSGSSTRHLLAVAGNGNTNNDRTVHV